MRSYASITSIVVLLVSTILVTTRPVDALDYQGMVNERISDDRRMVFIQTFYEINNSDRTKKVEVAFYCKNILSHPATCLSSSSLIMNDTDGNEYPVYPSTFVPRLRIPTFDVINLWLRFDMPIDSVPDSLIIRDRDSTFAIKLDSKKQPSDSIPESNWKASFSPGSSSKDAEKEIRATDTAAEGNVLMLKAKFSNVGNRDSVSFNSQFLYLKDGVNKVYKRTSIPSSISSDYKPELTVGSLVRGESEEGWVAFHFPEGLDNRNINNYMLIYDEVDGSFLNTGEFKDNIKPRILLPPSPLIVKRSSSNLGTVVNYNVTAVDDHSNPVLLSCSPQSGALFHVGETIVRCQATDGAGNSFKDEFTVSVVESLAKASTNALSIGGKSYDITTISETAKVKGFTVDQRANSLVVELSADKEEEITMTFPNEVIAGINRVSADGDDISFSIVEESDTQTSIRFMLPGSIPHIEIHGARVIPEFGVVGFVLFLGSLLAAVGLRFLSVKTKNSL